MCYQMALANMLQIRDDVNKIIVNNRVEYKMHLTT